MYSPAFEQFINDEYEVAPPVFGLFMDTVTLEQSSIKEDIFSGVSGLVWVKQESREDAVILTAGIRPIPVSEGLHPHLITHRQPQHHQSGRLVDVLTVQRVPCPYPPWPIHH